MINTSEDLMILIIKGVLYYDIFMQCEFTFHTYIIAWTNDIPALSKVMNITDHNSYLSCRFCDIWEIYSQKYRYVYFPTNLKERYTKKNYSTWLTHINKIETATTTKEKETLIKQYGIIIIMIICIIVFVIIINDLI